MLVGNDIVDLHDPWSQPNEIHPRFDSRAFTADERAQIRESSSAHELRWSFWAAKESAFKVALKQDAGVRFLPKEFVVRLLDDSRAEVSHRLGRFRIWFERADEWLHAVAVPEIDRLMAPGPDIAGPGGAPAGVDSRIDLVDKEDVVLGEAGRPGRRVREVARSAVGSWMDIAANEIQIVTEQGIPTLRRRIERLPTERLSLDLSLSHHGRFVACAWAEHGRLSG